MKKTTQVLVNKVLSGGCSDDKKIAWIDFTVDQENVLRLAFPVKFQFDLKLSLQQLQLHISEDRKKAGLPVIEDTCIVAVERLEYYHDDINQIALIRTRFQNGAASDIPIEKAQIPQLIEFLNKALAAFGTQSKNPKH